MFYICKECSDARDSTEVIILNCKHCFCLVCFEKYLIKNMASEFKCPLNRCNMKVEETQLRMILCDDDLLRYDALCMEGVPKTHKCLLSNCSHISKYEEGASNYTCSVCSLYNCIQCNATHKKISCKDYQNMSDEERTKIHQSALEEANKVLVQKARVAVIEASMKDLSLNEKVFECMLCSHCIAKGNGVRLRSCFHCICRPCLIKLVKNTHTIPVKCPIGDCHCLIEDREVKCILTKAEYEVFERKGLNRAKNKLTNAFQCRQANCDFFCILTDKNAKRFKCPKCKTTNCLICSDVHTGKTCKEHQEKMKQGVLNIETSMMNGEFMRCPDCGNYVTKSRGCNWIKCPRCNLELCWILKMRRWGPKGPGDTSGGCKCEPNKFCHPKCNGCIPES